MKQYIIMLISTFSILGSVFLFSALVKTETPTIVITEIGAYEGNSHEWIEIYNAGTKAIDLTDWKFVENNTNHGLSVSQGDAIINPGSYAIITQNYINFLTDYPNVSASIFDSSWGTLNENGEKIGLKDENGNLVEQFTYISAPDFSLERIDPLSNDYTDTNWKEHPNGNTVGTKNYWHVNNGNTEPNETNEPPVAFFSVSSSSVKIDTDITFDASASTDDTNIISYVWDFGDDTSATNITTIHAYTTTGTYTVSLTITDNEGLFVSTSTEILITSNTSYEEEIATSTNQKAKTILINEFLPDPNTGESEWIELFNASTSSINLSNYTLHEGAGKITMPTSTIEALGFAIIILPTSKLNNVGDLLELKNIAGDIVDTVAFGNWENATISAPKKGNTLARDDDGTFIETTTPTKGTKNKITSPITNNPSSSGGGSSSVSTPIAKTYNASIIVINEFVSDPTDGQEEFIELFNTGSHSIDLNGWWIEDGSETKTTLSGTIASKKFSIVLSPKGNLNNGGDIIILFDPSGKEIDSVTYGNWDDGNLSDNAPAPSDPLSLARRIDGLDANNDFYDFVLTQTITKDKSNIISLITENEYGTGQILGTKIFTSAVKITELYPNPPGSDTTDEFIELLNTSDKTVDITNWKLGDSSSKRYVIKNGIIAPGAYLVLKRAITGIALNNSGGDTVGLYDPNGAIVEKTQYYGSAREGESWAKKEDGSWAWTTEVTPSEANKITGKSAAPIITIDVDTEVAVGEQVRFDASDTTDPDAEKMTFVWSFGDNGTDEGDVVEHAFSEEGTYSVTLVVTDASGNSSKKEVIVMVKNRLSFAGGFNSKTPIEKIEISEILPNPTGSDTTEFVELFNPTKEIIDLTDMKLDDEEGGSRAYNIPRGTIIESGAHLVFGRQDTKIAFNNTSDSARILYPDGTVLLDIRYDDVLEGHSYVRDKNDEWVWTSTITPGEATVLSPPDIGKANKTTTSKSKMVKPIIKTTLANLRNEDIGDIVTVTGTVAVLPNVFGTQYFYIVGSPGVQVYMHNKNFPHLSIGDVVQITGEISEAGGETRVKLKEKIDITVIEHGSLPNARPIDIATIGEEYEGWLIEVHGEITELKSTYMYVDDGTDEVQVYFKRGAGINTKIYQLGDLISVVGIVSQTKTGYRVLPRSAKDIIKTGVVEEAISRQEALKEKSSKEVAEKYLTATAGGITALLVGLFAKTAKTEKGLMQKIILFFRRKKQ